MQRVLSGALVCIAVAATSAASSVNRNNVNVEEAALTIPARAPCTGECRDCSATKHADFSETPIWSYTVSVYHMADCEGAGNCSQAGHTQNCEEVSGGDDLAAFSVQKYDDVRKAVLNGDHRELRSLLAHYGGFARYVPSRGAVQIRSCSGELIANLPVDQSIANVQ